MRTLSWDKCGARSETTLPLHLSDAPVAPPPAALATRPLEGCLSPRWVRGLHSVSIGAFLDGGPGGGSKPRSQKDCELAS